MKIQTFESLGQYHDSWALIIGCAPDHFPEYDWDIPPRSQAQRLEEAFASLRAGAHFAEKKIKTPRLISVFHELLKMSHEAFLRGDRQRGCHVLQEAEGLVWPSRATHPKHVVEAERRAFGDVVLFKEVVVSPFPYEGSEADLGDIQRKLWMHASAQMDALSNDKISETQTWVADSNGEIHVVKARSKKGVLQAVSDGVRLAQIQGYAMATLIGHDLLIVDVEQYGKPRISIRRLTKPGDTLNPRFHLYKPDVFTQQDG
ncbi:hypothetical protein GCM10010970_31060 [Silvimonas iriomotensis]|uniref:Uncharacterized protein n=2 Tax=Silvimonas iriomotensis TaxID=449662 RepID=A0ABQ2PCP0_9NEIS|nr:hypothetical protein GCM10010970_31060 [Silvimonas iriomotensis]